MKKREDEKRTGEKDGRLPSASHINGRPRGLCMEAVV